MGEFFGSEFFVELLGAAHVTVVGDGDTGHFHFFCHFYQPGGGTGTVKHTVVGMQMQMNKISRHDYKSFLI